MTSNRPYLLRAICEWILDNSMTPYLIVDATVEGTEVPDQYIEDGRIILNIHPDAVHNINISNEDVEFSARFNGKSCNLNIPMPAVLAIYARENGKGMIFPEEVQEENKANESPEDKNGNSRVPHLKVIK